MTHTRNDPPMGEPQFDQLFMECQGNKYGCWFFNKFWELFYMVQPNEIGHPIYRKMEVLCRINNHGWRLKAVKNQKP